MSAQGNRVGQAYKSKRSAQAYAERNWTGPQVPDRDDWIIEIQQDEDGWWCYIRARQETDERNGMNKKIDHYVDALNEGAAIDETAVARELLRIKTAQGRDEMIRNLATLIETQRGNG